MSEGKFIIPDPGKWLLTWEQVTAIRSPTIEEILRDERSQDRILGQIKLRVEGKDDSD